MTVFFIVCVAMVIAALLLIARPLLSGSVANDQASNSTTRKSLHKSSGKNYGGFIVIAILVSVVATTLYWKLGRVHWETELAANTVAAANPSKPDVQAMIAKLEQRLSKAPNDVDGWLMLGRSYAALEQNTQALVAFQKSYDQSGGNNTEAALGLAETMIALDERSIVGKAGELFDAVLIKEPDNPKALWYGAVASLAAKNLPLAHDRLKRMLVLNPPEQIRSIIERQIQDIEQQQGTISGKPAAGNATLAKKGTSASSKTALDGNTALAGKTALAVQVSIEPKLMAGLEKKTALFIAVRDPAVPGPPLAALRRVVDDLPIVATLTDNDAMLQGRGISSVTRVQVVARISKSGMPQAQPGDLYGDATVDIAKDKSVPVKIVINRVVEAGSK